MYTLIASRKPRVLLEIGSGNSTKFAYRAKKDHSPSTKIISIDPSPRSEIDLICDEIIREPLENVDLSLLQELEKGDIVFFDGSHRCFQNSDVTVFFVEVLPALTSGVTVGVHDIFWPQDYPRNWVERYYNEQYILAAYMLAIGDEFPLIFSCAYMGASYQAQVRECFSPGLVKQLDAKRVGIRGGALWFSKHEVCFSSLPIG